MEYEQVPALQNGALAMSGRVKNGVQFQDEQDLSIQIDYDPPPRQLTLGQLSRIYCSRNGLHVASLRRPETGDLVYFRARLAGGLRAVHVLIHTMSQPTLLLLIPTKRRMPCGSRHMMPVRDRYRTRTSSWRWSPRPGGR